MPNDEVPPHLTDEIKRQTNEANDERDRQRDVIRSFAINGDIIMIYRKNTNGSDDGLTPPRVAVHQLSSLQSQHAEAWCAMSDYDRYLTTRQR
jgi:hypothetical protein